MFNTLKEVSIGQNGAVLSRGALVEYLNRYFSMQYCVLRTTDMSGSEEALQHTQSGRAGDVIPIGAGTPYFFMETGRDVELEPIPLPEYAHVTETDSTRIVRWSHWMPDVQVLMSGQPEQQAPGTLRAQEIVTSIGTPPSPDPAI